jgi:hypothetical protein
MTDRKLHTEAYREWKENAADHYIQAQRQAFLDGFEAAAQEGEQFTLLRNWLEEQRDKAKERHDESDDIDDLARYHAFVAVLVKLSEMGNHPEENCHE